MMATGKKLFWIKLKNTFMTSDAVDFLMSQKNGANYVVIYQMLCLMTLGTNGVLQRTLGEVIIPYDVDKIQRECKYFDRDTIIVAMELFAKLNLIYRDDNGVYVITDYRELIGKETDYAGQKRVQRSRQKQLPEYGQSADTTVDIVHTEKEKDIEIDKEIEKEKDIEIDKDINNSIKDACSSDEERTSLQKDIKAVIEAWNQLPLNKVTTIKSGTKRHDALVARIRQYGIESVLEAVNMISQSPFLLGQKTDFIITFDWFVRPNNFIKVYEGNYLDRGFKSAKDMTFAERLEDA